jgi:hypothetical protein
MQLDYVLEGSNEQFAEMTKQTCFKVSEAELTLFSEADCKTTTSYSGRSRGQSESSKLEDRVALILQQFGASDCDTLEDLALLLANIKETQPAYYDATLHLIQALCR